MEGPEAPCKSPGRLQRRSIWSLKKAESYLPFACNRSGKLATRLPRPSKHKHGLLPYKAGIWLP